jgi:hypothetical protein
VTDRFPEVFALARFELQRRHVQPLRVIRAVLVGDQDHLPDLVHHQQKSKLLGDSFFFAIRRKVSGQACRAARHDEPVVPRQLERIHQEVVEVL